MDFAFSEEQELLRAAARDWLADRLGVDRVAELADGQAGWDPASWAEVAELGWLGLSVPEEHGGLGAGFVHEAVLFEEAGRALYPGPFFATVGLALPALEAGRDADPKALDAVLAGERSATLAWAEEGGPPTIAEAGASACVASPTGDGWALDGAKRFVPDLALVDDAVVVARAEGGVGLWRVDLRAHPATVVPRATVDTTRRLGDLVLEGTPATVLVRPGGSGAQAGPVLARTRLRALAALACEAVGVAQRALAYASEYAGQRQQFGRYIGSFQAVSHRIADVFVATELARSLAYWAAWAVAEADGQAPAACAAAKAAAGEAAVFATESAIQCMGGIAFTWDHPLHRFYKRAQWIETFEGGGPHQRRDLAAALLDGPGPR